MFWVHVATPSSSASRATYSCMLPQRSYAGSRGPTRSRRAALLRLLWAGACAAVVSSALVIYLLTSSTTFLFPAPLARPRRHDDGFTILNSTGVRHANLGRAAYTVDMGTHPVIDELGIPHDLGPAQVSNPATLPLPAVSKWQLVGALRIHRMVMVHEVSEHDWKVFACVTPLTITLCR